MTMYRKQTIPFKAGSYFVYNTTQRDALKKTPGAMAYVNGLGLYVSDGISWTMAIPDPTKAMFSYSSPSFTGADYTDGTYTGPDVGTATVDEVNDIMQVFVGGVLQTYVNTTPAIDEYTFDHTLGRWTFGVPLTGQSLHIYAKILA